MTSYLRDTFYDYLISTAHVSAEHVPYYVGGVRQATVLDRVPRPHLGSVRGPIWNCIDIVRVRHSWLKSARRNKWILKTILKL